MVATVTPPSVTGLAQPNAFAPREARETRQDATNGAPLDTVSVNDAAVSWRAARDGVRQSLADIDLTLAVGRDALKLVGQIGEAARAGDDDAVQSLITQLDDSVKAGVAAGAAALTGATVRVQTERDAPAFEIDGLDLRVKEQANEGDALRISTESAADAATVRNAEESAQRIQAGLDRLRAAAQRLETHAGFLATAESSVVGARPDLDADSARLLALQVRQGLSETGVAIASARPDSVLGLFRE